MLVIVVVFLVEVTFLRWLSLDFFFTFDIFESPFEVVDGRESAVFQRHETAEFGFGKSNGLGAFRVFALDFEVDGAL